MQGLYLQLSSETDGVQGLERVRAMGVARSGIALVRLWSWRMLYARIKPCPIPSRPSNPSVPRSSAKSPNSAIFAAAHGSSARECPGRWAGPMPSLHSAAVGSMASSKTTGRAAPPNLHVAHPCVTSRVPHLPAGMPGSPGLARQIQRDASDARVASQRHMGSSPCRPST